MLYFSISIIAVIVLLNLVGLLIGPKEKKGSVYLPGAYVIVLTVLAVRDRLMPDQSAEGLRYYDEVYIGENPETVRLRLCMKYAGAGMLILLFSAGLYLTLKFGGIFEPEKISSLKRPQKGSESYELLAEYEDKKYEFSLFLDPAKPGAAETEEILEQVEKKLPDYILDGNPDAQHVTYNLRLPAAFLYDWVKISWSSSDSSLVGSDGSVASDRIYRKQRVTLTAYISCFEESRKYDYELVICPLNEESRNLAGIKEKTEKAADENSGNEEVELPDSFEGSQVSYSIKKGDNSAALFLLGIIAAIMMLPYGLQVKRQKAEKRNTELICDYPELISKLSLLLSSGLGIRVAFERIAADYEKRRQNGKRKKQYLYEEMIRTRNEMALGLSETEAYENFGKRCRNMYYIRLASILCRNVKKGSESIIVALHQELGEAARERQAQIRKKGEETGMKLLLPMAGLFALVLVVILVPAFMTM